MTWLESNISVIATVVSVLASIINVSVFIFIGFQRRLRPRQEILEQRVSVDDAAKQREEYPAISLELPDLSSRKIKVVREVFEHYQLAK